MAKGDVIFVSLPLVSGSRAQGGRRPAILVISESALINNPMALLIPLTSKTAALRFPFTIQIEPSKQNGLSAPSVALVFQLVAADRMHLDSVIGKIEENYLQEIDKMMRQLLTL